MNGLGQIGAPQQQAAQQTQGLGSLAPRRNSSLEMFELANAERMKAREMKLENEAMKAKAEQQMLQAERGSIVDNQILSALKQGQIDEQTAWDIFQDRNVSQATKQAVADVFYPNQALKEMPASQDEIDFYGKDGVYVPRTHDTTDKERQAEIDARSAAIGRPGERNMQFIDPAEQSREKWIRRSDYSGMTDEEFYGMDGHSTVSSKNNSKNRSVPADDFYNETTPFM